MSSRRSSSSGGNACNRKLNRMWRLWYALLVLALQLFLLCAAARRYLDYRGRAMRESWRVEPMHSYLAAIISAVCLLTLFVYSALSPTGNYADDGVALGRDRASLRAAIAEATASSAASASVTCAGRLRRHFLPPTCCLHLLVAMCLLAPLPALEAVAVTHEERPRDAVWSTSLDFLVRPERHRSTSAVSAELFNLVLALCILLVRYPSVFWFAAAAAAAAAAVRGVRLDRQ